LYKAKPMNELIQKLIEIDSLDAQIQSLRLENPDSTRIAPRKENRDRLLKEAFTALCREYYRNATWTPDRPTPKSMTEVIKVIKEITDVAKMRIFNACNYRTDEETALIVATSVIKKCDLGSFADRIEELTECGLLEEERLEEISCSICGDSFYVDKPQYPLGESFSAKCNGCHHIEEIANISPATRSGSFQAVKPLIELSPGTTKNLDVEWLIEHIDDGYDFDEIYKEAEEDGLNTFYFFYLRELLEEQQINIDLLRGLSRGDLRKLLTEKIAEYDFLVQKTGFAELLEDAESNAYHVKRMVVLLKEAAAAIAASGSNPEILAKLQGYVDLSN